MIAQKDSDPGDGLDYVRRPLAITLYASKATNTPVKSGFKRWSRLVQQLSVRDLRESKDGPAFSMATLLSTILKTCDGGLSSS